MATSFCSPCGIDENRRRWLVATSVAGGAAGIATLTPFVVSLDPPASAVAAGAPVSVPIGGLAPGAMLTVAWRGKPVFVVHRTPAMLAAVRAATPDVADPDTLHPFSMPLPGYCANPYRARTGRIELLVVLGVCTHLGCTPSPRFQPGPQANLPDNWPGGFLCPCHGSTYDLAGRVFKDKPAPQNLDVPRFMFPSADQLVIGKDEAGDA